MARTHRDKLTTADRIARARERAERAERARIRRRAAQGSPFALDAFETVPDAVVRVRHTA